MGTYTPVNGIPLRDALARRAELVRGRPPAGERGPPLKLLVGEIGAFVRSWLRPFRRSLVLPETRRPAVVMLLPGFATHPVRMRRMARLLAKSGHTVRHWGLGWNLGPTEQKFAALDDRIARLHREHGQPVVLVGWSLGGIFARELAKRQPQAVAKVVTMGSPFSGSLYANNVWRLYQLITGHRVDQPPIRADLRAKPPVNTVALWSARDGIVSPRCACGRAEERDRAVPLRCTHLGFAYSDEAICAVWRELERD